MQMALFRISALVAQVVREPRGGLQWLPTSTAIEGDAGYADILGVGINHLLISAAATLQLIADEDALDGDGGGGWLRRAGYSTVACAVWLPASRRGHAAVLPETFSVQLAGMQWW